MPPQLAIMRLVIDSVRALRSSMRCRSFALKSPRRCFSRLRWKRATSSRSIGGFGIERIIASIISLYKGTIFILNTNTIRMKNFGRCVPVRSLLSAGMKKCLSNTKQGCRFSVWRKRTLRIIKFGKVNEMNYLCLDNLSRRDGDTGKTCSSGL